MTQYILGELIGSGTYGDVYEAFNAETRERVALKRIRLNEREGMPGTALREISILKRLDHTNIIRLITIIHTDTLLTMVFPYIEYELKNYILIHQNADRMNLIAQLACGIDYLHKMNVIHRDIKPQNILVTHDGVLKIADFGLSRNMEVRVPPYSSEVVTLWYRSPELLVGNTSYRFYIDIWSLGCVVYEIMTMEPLFPGESKENQLALIRRIAGARKPLMKFIESKEIPETISNIIMGCIDLNYETRISMNEILRFLHSEGYSGVYSDVSRDIESVPVIHSNFNSKRPQNDV
ncbi:cyclin-dependent protein kinase [Ordospora colligata]|uniref:Cyclin-dependent protein kinase n=1 Tax=Ordospora colligata OC4 TaxID=1354746 RepID=A0A0B2UIM9_9MICR|nr:cyclin-dependent protein kinase [Ordospora colligata OC4]KHN69094.1 cyclin-dependent protein kinase [Ordospora colligata OC4]TBU18177.1 cyclin-dependent protein kinase [Ordospora colligata]